MKRIIPIITLTAIVLCMMKNIQVKADTLPASYEILAGQPGVDLTSIISAYEALNSEQKLIAEYLVGAYNNIYLTARGFKYNVPYDQTNLQAEFSAIGSRVFDFITTRIGWKSRVNEVFRQFLSSVVVYAYGIHTTFLTWFSGQVNGTDRIVFIPYSEEAFDAWTTFYNDPSGDGIASFGDIVANWTSGEFIDFAFTNIAWLNNAQRNYYDNFILNNSPVIYTQSYQKPNETAVGQFVVGMGEHKVLDALFILRDASNYNQFRFGFSDFSNANVSIPVMETYTRNGESKLLSQWYGNVQYNLSVQTYSGTHTAAELIDYAFFNTPLSITFSYGSLNFRGQGFYPFITHVFVVDDLLTLSNPEEIYDTIGLNTVSPDNDKLIIAPNGRLILPSWPGAPDDPLGFWDLIVDNSFTEDGDEVTDDDFHTSIVNNNVINNYYVTDDVKINVPADWFENPYTDQLNTEAQDFIGFAKDCVDCLGDFDIYMYGAIVVGLAGGIVKKLLL